MILVFVLVFVIVLLLILGYLNVPSHKISSPSHLQRKNYNNLISSSSTKYLAVDHLEQVLKKLDLITVSIPEQKLKIIEEFKVLGTKVKIDFDLLISDLKLLKEHLDSLNTNDMFNGVRETNINIKKITQEIIPTLELSLKNMLNNLLAKTTAGCGIDEVKKIIEDPTKDIKLLKSILEPVKTSLVPKNLDLQSVKQQILTDIKAYLNKPITQINQIHDRNNLLAKTTAGCGIDEVKQIIEDPTKDIKLIKSILEPVKTSLVPENLDLQNVKQQILTDIKAYLNKPITQINQIHDRNVIPSFKIDIEPIKTIIESKETELKTFCKVLVDERTPFRHVKYINDVIEIISRQNDAGNLADLVNNFKAIVNGIKEFGKSVRRELKIPAGQSISLKSITDNFIGSDFKSMKITLDKLVDKTLDKTLFQNLHDGILNSIDSNFRKLQTQLEDYADDVLRLTQIMNEFILNMNKNKN